MAASVGKGHVRHHSLTGWPAESRGAEAPPPLLGRQHEKARLRRIGRFPEGSRRPLVHGGRLFLPCPRSPRVASLLLRHRLLPPRRRRTRLLPPPRSPSRGVGRPLQPNRRPQPPPSVAAALPSAACRRPTPAAPHPMPLSVACRPPPSALRRPPPALRRPQAVLRRPQAALSCPAPPLLPPSSLPSAALPPTHRERHVATATWITCTLRPADRAHAATRSAGACRPRRRRIDARGGPTIGHAHEAAPIHRTPLRHMLLESVLAALHAMPFAVTDAIWSSIMHA